MTQTTLEHLRKQVEQAREYKFNEVFICLTLTEAEGLLNADPRGAVAGLAGTGYVREETIHA